MVIIIIYVIFIVQCIRHFYSERVRMMQNASHVDTRFALNVILNVQQTVTKTCLSPGDHCFKSVAETNCVCKIDLKKSHFNGHLGSLTQSPLYYILSFYFKRALLRVNYLTLYKCIIAQKKKKYPKGKKNDERKKRYNTQRSKHELDQRTHARCRPNRRYS